VIQLFHFTTKPAEEDCRGGKNADRFGVDNLTIQLEKRPTLKTSNSFLARGHGLFSIGEGIGG